MSKLCYACGQVMPAYDNPFDLTQLVTAIKNDNIEWAYLSVNNIFTIQDMPEDAVVTVVAEDFETTSDSYGYSEEASGYVVFNIDYCGKSENFKIEGTKSSYDGWDWDESNITKVSATPKTITVWESI